MIRRVPTGSILLLNSHDRFKFQFNIACFAYITQFKNWLYMHIKLTKISSFQMSVLSSFLEHRSWYTHLSSSKLGRYTQHVYGYTYLVSLKKYTFIKFLQVSMWYRLRHVKQLHGYKSWLQISLFYISNSQRHW